MRFNSLDQWLQWQEKLHPTEIELGLDRTREVLNRLLKDFSIQTPPFQVVSIAGTNGKGSCATLLNAIYAAAGYKVGLYTSPHLKKYNERIRINDNMVADHELCESFERIDKARGDTSLTYFEFGTLAAIDLFLQAHVDIAILEVGLGGRLDAVNVLNADVALITSIGVDHQAWLGDTREQIALEKVAIARAGKPVVCGDIDPPQTMLDHIAQLTGQLYLIGQEFEVLSSSETQWSWCGLERVRSGLPLPAMRGSTQLQNAASVLMVAELMKEHFPVSQVHIRQGLISAIIPGRLQTVTEQNRNFILDVAHNIQAVQVLQKGIREISGDGKVLAVFAVLKDKDIAGILDVLREDIDEWYFADLNVKRAASADDIKQLADACGIENPIRCYNSVQLAKEAAVLHATENDQIVVFGSFYTVSEVL